MKRFFMVLWMTVMIPYVTTLVWTGRIRTDTGPEVPAEEFLTGVVAAEIPAEYGIETLKAQAVLAKDIYLPACGSGAGTYPGRGTGHRLSQHEGDGEKWGKEHFREYYGKIRTAVQETEGLVAEYDGELIEPFYCEASAGKTRELAAYPYICSVESPGDLEAGEFLCVRTFTEAEFADKIGRIGGPRPGADGIAGKIQIIERDDAGYVKRVQIGDMDYTGDEVRDSLGLLSSCFHFSSADGKIRVSSKGIGSGYGFSQAGADAMEREQGE